MRFTPGQFKTIINYLVDTTLKREFSAYISEFKRDVIVCIEHIGFLDGFNVYFTALPETQKKTERFSYVNGSDIDLEAHVREGIVRILGLSNI